MADPTTELNENKIDLENLVAGVGPSGERVYLQVDADGVLKSALEAGDVQIGAVEIKDATTDERVNVTWDGFYSAMAVTDGRMVFNVDDNGIADSQIPQTTLDLNYGYENKRHARPVAETVRVDRCMGFYFSFIW